MQTIRELRSDLYAKIKENKSKIKEIKSSMQLYFDLRDSINDLENFKNDILESLYGEAKYNKIYMDFIDGVIYDVAFKISEARESFSVELKDDSNSNKIDEINKLDMEISNWQQLVEQYTEYIDYQVLKEYKELHEYQGSDYLYNESNGQIKEGFTDEDFDRLIS